MGGAFVGTIPVAGQHVFSAITLDFDPLNATLGVGGQTSQSSGGGFARVTQLDQWQTETTTLFSGTFPISQSGIPFTAMGFVHGPASATSTAAQPSGVLQFVSPTQLSGSAFPFTSVSQKGHVSRLTIRLVPEPETFATLASGTVLLALLGWRRSRRP